MKKNILFVLLIFILVVSACKPSPGAPTPSSSSSELPTPPVSVSSVPDVASTVDQYLELWQANDYAGMYALLAQTSKDAISESDFVKLYADTAAALTLNKTEAGIVSTLVRPASAEVGYQVNYITSIFGIISRTMQMNLILTNNAWQIQWQDGMILPEMAGGNRLVTNFTAPARGDITDKNGETLVTKSQAVALGLIPSQISSTYETGMIDILAAAMNKPRNIIRDTYSNSEDWYVPIGEISQAGYERWGNSIESYSGIVINPYSSRYYFNSGIAPQVLGYMRSIFPEEVDEYTRLGYSKDARIGAAGIEKWGESYLAGLPSADLYVVKPDGTYDTRLASVDPKAADTISLTLDKNFQILVQKALLGFTGAIIVMEVDTGRILAMASSPDFDPNVMQPDNYNYQYSYNKIVSDSEGAPLWNRAIQSSYPPGSIFKVVTMAAALESGLYTPDSTYECTSQYTELAGFVGNDWTFDKGLPPSGELTLVKGLMRSCNPWFYHLGLDLYQTMGASYLADMARGFGLGSATGIDVLQEDPGSVNDPSTDGAAVQMGIGQGDMLVTPIQVVDFMAAIANGGTLFKPQIIERITDINGNLVKSFSPVVRGTLPVSADTLTAIQQGMFEVVHNEKGTANNVFIGMQIPVYGKTGTATTSIIDPHSWFAGFTNANNPNKPDIAIVVIAENAGDGSKFAAPIFKRVVQNYFLGEPQTLYSWEKDYYLTKTPLPEESQTPQP